MKINFSRNFSRAGILWTVIILLCGIYILQQLAHRDHVFTTNILALIPLQDQDPARAAIVTKASAQLENKCTFIFEGEPQTILSRAAFEFEQTFARAVPEVQITNTNTSTVTKDLTRILSSNAAFLLPKEDGLRLQSESEIQNYLDESKAFLSAPFFSRMGLDLRKDPLLIAPRLLLRKKATLHFDSDPMGRIVVKENGDEILVSQCEIHGPIFSKELQTRLNEAYKASVTLLAQKFPQIKVSRSGLVWFATSTAAHLEEEVALLNLLSLFGTLILFFFVFRSLTALLITLIPLVAGAITALAVSLLFFPELHAVTIGFGSILVGGCTDYGVHYLITYVSLAKSPHRAELTFREVFGGLTLGMLSSIAAFAALFFTPLPILVQIAVFSATGLFGAYCTVVTLFPFLATILLKSHEMKVISFSVQTPKAIKLLTLVFLGMISIVGFTKLKANDDIRLLTQPDAHLLIQEKHVQELLGNYEPGRYIIVEGDTPEEVMDRENQVRHSFPLENSSGITDFLPDVETATTSKVAVNFMCSNYSSLLRSYAQDIGLPPDAIAHFCHSAENQLSLLEILNEFSNSSLKSITNLFWSGQTNRGYASVVRLRNASALHNDALNAPGVSLVDRVADISELLKTYRLRASYLTLLSYLGISVVLCFRYGIAKSIRLLVPPFVGAFVALAMIGLTGGSLNVFSIFGILITLGLGVDFTLFIEESPSHKTAALLGVVTSALTSLLSFGLLAFSTVPLLNQFGVAVSAGISVAMLLAVVTTGNNEKV